MKEDKVYDEPNCFGDDKCILCEAEDAQELEGVGLICEECAEDYVKCSVCGEYSHRDMYIGCDMVETEEDLNERISSGKTVCHKCYYNPEDEEIIKFFTALYMVSTPPRLRIFYSRMIDDMKEAMKGRKRVRENLKLIKEIQKRNTLSGCKVGETYITEQGWLMHKCKETLGSSVIMETMTCSSCGAQIGKDAMTNDPDKK